MHNKINHDGTTDATKDIEPLIFFRRVRRVVVVQLIP
jgi:hypothetical protein